MSRLKTQSLRIKIKNSQRKIIINKKNITSLAGQILKTKGITQAELSIVFVSKRYIRALNKQFRKVDRPTDVLAFSMQQAAGPKPHPEILGDVVICPQVAQEFSQIYQTSQDNELYLYLVHGILHLLGYDDHDANSRLLMEQEQLRILKQLIRR